MNFLFISGPEIIIVILIVVMLFGADKIPEIARGLGKGMRQLRDATNEVKREINQTAKKHNIDTDIIKDIKKEIHQVKENIEEYTGSIKRGSKF
ncbi:MAG TPA: twin-arginine translocase TatA/TatE family subunit [Lutibacter sp.]|nr:twin-arginine translocase TatA/TatE family subunit [Lutibacter sp.]